MKIKLRAGLLTGLFLILAGISVLFSYLDVTYHVEAAAGTAAETDTGRTYINVAGHEIALWQQEGQSYAFLPSACKGVGVEPEIPEGTDWDSIVWLYSENIPAVFIDTESGTAKQIHADKNVKEAGEVSVLGADARPA